MSSAENSLRSALAVASRLRSAPRPKAFFLDFNVWLIPIGVIGAIVAIADGLSRPFNQEMLDVAIEPLTYQPYQGALVFALLMLPLVLVYSSSARIPKAEGLLLWFVMCTVAYTKDFSYVGIPGTKIFVTEGVLALLLLSHLTALAKSLPALGRNMMLGLLGLFLAGAIAAARGVLSSQDKMLVARDSVLVGYALFLPLGFLLLSSWQSVRRFFIFLSLGAIMASLNGIGWFLAQPGQRRYIDYGPYVLFCFVGCVILTSNRMIRPVTGWLVSGMLFVGILLANARTIYAVLALALVGIMVVSPSARLRLSARTLKRIAGASVVLVLVLWIFSQSKTGSDFIETAGTELVSGTVNYSDDVNANFRFLAWLEALQRFSAQPVTGEGFGIPFSFELSDTDPRPHNTYLTILYKTGLLGIIPLVLLLASFHWKGWHCLRTAPGGRDSLLLYILLIGQLIMAVYGFLNLLLESPFLASIYWLILGAGIRMMWLLRNSNSNKGPLLSAA
jgi:O-antigen ligase